VTIEGLKLTSYFGERDRFGRRLFADVLLDRYAEHGINTSLLLRGVSGFGPRHALRSDRLLTLSEDLPVLSVAVDQRARIERLAAELTELDHPGLLTLERAQLIAGEDPPEPTDHDEQTKLTIYTGRHERAGRRPGWVVACEILHREGLDGATVLLGVDGTRAGSRTRARFFGANRQVPVMLISIGSPERIAAVLPLLEQELGPLNGTFERVRVCKRDGRRLAGPHVLPPDELGHARWTKLMIHAAQDARVGHEPLGTALLRRLRGAGAAGACTLRGVWGFHGDHPPHGDRLLQVHRHVPTVTVVVERAERVAAAFAVIDELTAQRGLVTSEMVPAASIRTPVERRGGLRLARL
jgi:PII-like signaling protein